MKESLSSSSDFIARTVASTGDYFMVREVELGDIIDSETEFGFIHSTKLLAEEELKPLEMIQINTS